MDNLITMLIVFVVCFIGRLLAYVLKKKKKKKKNAMLSDMQYLVNKFNLDKKKIDKIGVASIISILDALIIAGTIGIIITVTDNIILEMLLGLVIVIIFIFIVYEIFGRILVKRGYGEK